MPRAASGRGSAGNGSSSPRRHRVRKSQDGGVIGRSSGWGQQESSAGAGERWGMRVNLPIRARHRAVRAPIHRCTEYSVHRTFRIRKRLACIYRGSHAFCCFARRCVHIHPQQRKVRVEGPSSEEGAIMPTEYTYGRTPSISPCCEASTLAVYANKWAPFPTRASQVDPGPTSPARPTQTVHASRTKNQIHL